MDRWTFRDVIYRNRYRNINKKLSLKWAEIFHGLGSGGWKHLECFWQDNQQDKYNFLIFDNWVVYVLAPKNAEMSC